MLKIRFKHIHVLMQPKIWCLATSQYSYEKCKAEDLILGHNFVPEILS